MRLCKPRPVLIFRKRPPRTLQARKGSLTEALSAILLPGRPEAICSRANGLSVDISDALRRVRRRTSGALDPNERSRIVFVSLVERLLCTAWLDPQLRQEWKNGFALFGAAPEVEHVCDAVYASSGYGGRKIAQFYRLYEQAGIVPTEIDYAFMVDRATQSSAPGKQIIATAKAAMTSPSAHPTAAELRRWPALNFRPSSQAADRLGRDVVFYIDALKQGLTPDERAACKSPNPMRASDAGLSDSVQLAEFSAPKLRYPVPPRGSESLTEAERAACPVTVLNPRAPVAVHQ